MANCGANHCSLSYVHIGANLITLVSMLRIPISMHNENDNEMFRLTAWNARIRRVQITGLVVLMELYTNN
jgi:L-fucose isomerase